MTTHTADLSEPKWEMWCSGVISVMTYADNLAAALGFLTGTSIFTSASATDRDDWDDREHLCIHCVPWDERHIEFSAKSSPARKAVAALVGCAQFCIVRAQASP